MAKITKKSLIEKSKGKNKILWDKVIWRADEYQTTLRIQDNRLSKKEIVTDIGLDYTDGLENGVCSFYFAIINTRNMIKTIKNRIRTQALSRSPFNRIVEEAVLASCKRCEIYRISSPGNIFLDFYMGRNPIYGGSRGLWVQDRSLHTKGPEALDNLLGKVRKGQI